MESKRENRHGVNRWLILSRIVHAGIALYILIGVVLTWVPFQREGCDDALIECAGLFTAGVFLWPLWVGR